jgi:ubiquinone/menaquinone biosynthesis C-methylase UbiE
MNDLASIYKKRFVDSGIERRQNVWRALCRFFFSRFVRPDDTVLDIACGYGEFINNIPAAKKFAIDLNPDSLRCLDPAVHFVNGAATDLSQFADSSVDVAFTSNFLEHLRDKMDVIELFRQVHRVLVPGGKMLILGPNIKYAYRDYWDFFDHYLPLSDASVGEALALTGFDLEMVIPRFLPFTMNNKAPTHDLIIFAYLRLPLAWLWFGKQFFIVAQKAT